MRERRDMNIWRRGKIVSEVLVVVGVGVVSGDEFVGFVFISLGFADIFQLKDMAVLSCFYGRVKC